MVTSCAHLAPTIVNLTIRSVSLLRYLQASRLVHRERSRLPCVGCIHLCLQTLVEADFVVVSFATLNS